MKIKFWGTRGSIPKPLTSVESEEKIFELLKLASNFHFNTDEEIRRFIHNSVPFYLKSTYGGNTPCIQIENKPDKFFLIDAGSGLRSFVKEESKNINKNKSNEFHIIISHLHWDHIQGFPFFVPAYNPNDKIFIYYFHKNCKSSLIDQMNSDNFPVTFEYLKSKIEFIELNPNKEFSIMDFSITPFEQIHPGVSYGLAIHKDGKKIVYSSDIEVTKYSYEGKMKYLDFIKNADVLIFDAQYSFIETFTTKEDWGHSYSMIGVELSLMADVKHLALFHHDANQSDKELDSILLETIQYKKYKSADSDLIISMAYDELEVNI